MIAIGKAPKQASLLDVAMQAHQLSQDVQLALDRGFKIIQLDEFVVTKNTWPTHAWMVKKDNITIDQSKAYNKTLAVVMAISRECGVELVDVYEESINKLKFKLFLQNLRQRNPFNDVMLVMDNLSVHKSGEVKERMEELGFLYTFTPAYSPQYNGIEQVINIGKKVVKQERLELVQRDEPANLRQIIADAFYGINI